LKHVLHKFYKNGEAARLRGRKGGYQMAIKELPEGYQAGIGDWRIKDTLTGTFTVSLFADSEWIDLQPVPTFGDFVSVGAITEGMELLGRRDGAYYYRPGQEKGLLPVQWPKNESNAGWTQPRFVFGQVVWDRLNPKRVPKVVTGIRFVPAYQDHPSPQSEDEDESSPQTWGYALNGGGEVEEVHLQARADLANLLAPRRGDPVLTGAGSDPAFDLFLDSDDLP
jgi:hypothetical protein